MASPRHRVRASNAPNTSTVVSFSRRRASSDRTIVLKYALEEPSAIASLKEYQARQQLVDPFKDHYGGGELQPIEPTYSPYALMRLPEENSSLKQCINAMVTNVHGHGYRLEYIGPEGEMGTPAVQAEKQDIENLIHYPNDTASLQDLRDCIGVDYETQGVSYVEIGRDRKGRINMLAHVPAHTLRRTTRDIEATEVEVNLPRDGAQKTTVLKRFCRYVQTVGNRRRYFKEYGDPRKINPETGRAATSLAYAKSATEIYAFQIYTPGSPYGLPRWFHQLPSITGSRQAELTNLDFFKENAIPAMALLVSGGLVTEEGMQSIADAIAGVRGRKSMNRVAVIEVGGDPNNASENGSVPVPKVELKPLREDRQQDALFGEYEKSCADKIRSAFRLPPIFLGLAEDYTMATAKTSFEIAESQVFTPDRRRFDEFMNRCVLGSLGVKFWKFRTLPPRIASREDVISSLAVFERIGALTPNVTIGLANEFFDLQIEKVLEPWGDYPFSLVMQMVQTGQLKGEAFTDLAEYVQEPTPAPGAAAGQDNNPGKTPGSTEATGDVGAKVFDELEAADRVRKALIALRSAVHDSR